MFRIFKRIKHRWLRYLVITFLILFIVVGVVIAFISPIAKWYIEKNSEHLIGRKVKIGSLYLNPFTGCLDAQHVIMYEYKSPDTFITVGGLGVNLTVSKLFSKNYEVTSLTFDHLRVNVVQNDSVFNFNDLIAKDTTKPKDTAAVHFRLHNVRIRNSEFHYDELSIPVRYYITKVDIKCDRLDWDVDTTVVQYSFSSGIGSGDVKGNVVYDFKQQRYKLNTQVKKFDLKVLEQYMKDFANYGTFSAFLDADMHAAGGLQNKLDLQAHGKIAVSDFHFGKSPEEDYVSFKKFGLSIDSLNPAGKKYFFSAVVLDTPFIKYEKYDSLDNFTAMVGKKATNVKQAKAEHQNVNIIFLFANYVKDLAKNIVNSEYRLNEFQVNGAHLLYNDYSLVEKFSMTANPIVITAKDIDTRNKRMTLTLSSKFNPYGELSAHLDINPNDLGDFNLNYEMRKMPLPILNPYMITFTSHPFHKGTIELYGKWNVVNKQISSDNHLLLINPTPAAKIKKKDTKNVPVPLILTFVRDIHRRVDISLPITGNLNDPKYHLWDVILDVVTNIFVKPPTYPYRAVKEDAKQEKEDYELLEWQPMQWQLENDQMDQLRKISRYLFFHKSTTVNVRYSNYESREKEAIVLYEAKKKYFLASNHKKENELTKDDSIAIIKMSMEDQSFITYLNRATNAAKNDFATELKCRKLIGEKRINEEYRKLIEARQKQIDSFFKEKKVLNHFVNKTEANVVPPSGYSHIDFYYKGNQPPD